MAKGLIAICQFFDCDTCVNQTNTGKCMFRDSVASSLLMDGNNIRCKLYKFREVDSAAEV